MPPGRCGPIRKSMTAKKKRKRRRRGVHHTPPRNRVVSSPLRQALEATVIPRLNGDRRTWCPTVAQVTARLTAGRASRSATRHWLNGTRRAPAWFVAVLDGELARHIDREQSIRAALAAYEVRDPEREKALKAARMREHWRAGDPRFHTGKRASEAANATGPGKNDPHN